MKGIIRYGGHLLASLFLFYMAGLSATLLVMQSKWIDMRFDTEFLILVFMGWGLWFYFAALFMDEPRFAWWTGNRFTYLVLAAGAVIVTATMTTAPSSGGWLIVPAYASRKALFLDQMLTLPQMNILLVVWLLLGLAALLVCRRVPLAFSKGAPFHWRQLGRRKRAGILLLTGFFSVFVLFYFGQGEFQRAIHHASAIMKHADVEAFRDYLLSFGPLAAVVSGLLMVFQSLVAPLPAFVITFANGLLFGWVWGAVLSWSSAMVGAILCFYLARYYGRPPVEKLVSRAALDWADRFFARYGKHAIFIARLVPIVSFDLVSYAAGLTSISFRHFFWATGLGQLPATLLYSYLGQTATDTVNILFLLFTIVIALSVIGFLLRPRLNRALGKKSKSHQ